MDLQQVQTLGPVSLGCSICLRGDLSMTLPRTGGLVDTTGDVTTPHLLQFLSVHCIACIGTDRS